jgi:hypothetical protein
MEAGDIKRVLIEDSCLDLFVILSWWLQAIMRFRSF